MKQNIGKLLVIVVVFVVLLAGVLIGTQRTGASPSTHHASVCFLTGLTGPAQQENELYCATNALTGVATNCCTSTYQQAIHLAQQKHIVIGTPEFLSQTVDWAGVPVTMVRFNSGFYAWHYDPSNGIATIEDAYNHVYYSGR